MSGDAFPSSWEEEDRITGGEMIARHALADCRAPLLLTCGTTLITVRCSHCHRLVEHHEVYADGWETTR